MWRYLRAEIYGRLKTQTEYDIDIAFVRPPEHVQGWILDTFCNEIKRHLNVQTVDVVLDTDTLPCARAYFYPHYFYYRTFRLKFPEIARSRNVVLFTHPHEKEISDHEFRYLLNSADVVASMCTMFRDTLIKKGVHKDKIAVVLAGADPVRFSPHERGQQPVGLCSAYHSRKNPQLILDIISAAPHLNFVLIGKGWETWDHFDRLSKLPNFEYRNRISYEEMPNFYTSIDVFLSPSLLEGGPMPVLEAMMCNVVPVATNIGFCPDLITHGENGFLFEHEKEPHMIIGLIEQACKLRTDVRSTVENLSWQNYSQIMANLLLER